MNTLRAHAVMALFHHAAAKPRDEYGSRDPLPPGSPAADLMREGMSEQEAMRRAHGSPAARVMFGTSLRTE
jgi:hypothetical protein